MTALLIVVGTIIGIIALSYWLRHRDWDGYPSRRSMGEEEHPEPGLHYRPMESPPSPPFD